MLLLLRTPGYLRIKTDQVKCCKNNRLLPSSRAVSPLGDSDLDFSLLLSPGRLSGLAAAVAPLGRPRPLALATIPFLHQPAPPATETQATVTSAAGNPEKFTEKNFQQTVSFKLGQGMIEGNVLRANRLEGGGGYFSSDWRLK